MLDHLRLFAIALKNIAQGPITIRYPKEERDYGQRFRGYIVNDLSTCISCGLCEVVCPAKAVKFSVGPDGRRYPGIDWGRCILCGYCVDACPTGSLKHLDAHELIYHDVQETFDKYAIKLVERRERPRRALL